MSLQPKWNCLKYGGLSQWDNPGTGLEADDVTTLGIMTNYFFTDNISFEMKAGIPPEKSILQGKGKTYAAFFSKLQRLCWRRLQEM